VLLLPQPFLVLAGVFVALTIAMPQSTKEPIRQTTKTTMTTDRTTSIDGTSPEINTARADLAAKRSTADTTHKWFIASLALAAFAGFCILAATLQLDWKNEAVREAESRLTSLEMAKIEADAEEKIADAKRESDRNIEEARNDANKKIAVANLATEKERLERVKLEEDLSPRSFKESAEAIKRLSSFRGTTVLLEYPLDLECKATAERIAFVLNEAGWTIRPRPNNDPNAVFQEGIVVGYVGPSGTGVSPVPIVVPLPFEKTPPLKSAGEILLDELNSNEMDAHSTPGVGRIGEAVYVYVGFRPSPENKRAFKINREIERRISESVGKSQHPDLTDLIERAKKLRGAGARLQLPTQ
jgi:hypothetical protein